jgi:hypothetical protein
MLPRLIVRVLVAGAIVAALLGRWGRGTAAHLDPTLREPAFPRYHALNRFLLYGDSHAPRILDSETGAISVSNVPGVDGFAAAAVSPWRDAGGQHHLAGCWTGATEVGCGRIPGAMGVARWTFPEGRVLDRIAIDLVPFAPPCWFPDRSDRIVFAAGDGRLYLLAFPDAGHAEGAWTAARPRPIRWAIAPPEGDAPFIRDPCWPSGPALGGRLVVAINFRTRKGVSGPPLGSQLWWLQLSPDATAIVAAGRLIVPEEDEHAPADAECWPVVATTRDGVPMLAYLVANGGRFPFELRTAPITLEGGPAVGVPRVRAGAIRRLADVGVLTAPAFSPDARWVYAAVRDGRSGEVRVSRFAALSDDPQDPPAE